MLFVLKVKKIVKFDSLAMICVSIEKLSFKIFRRKNMFFFDLVHLVSNIKQTISKICTYDVNL